MSAPEFFLHLRMEQEQVPGKTALYDLHHIRDIELWFCVDENMDMVRHDLHSQDLEAVLFCKIRQKSLTVIIHPGGQHVPSVLCAPDDMILE